MNADPPPTDPAIEPFETTEPEPWLPEGVKTMMRGESAASSPSVARVRGHRRHTPDHDVTVEGVLEMLDQDGAIFGVAHYDHGVAHGEMRFFYPDGALRSRRVYEQGRPHGFCEEFEEDGTPASLTICRHGTAIGGSISFHPNGQPASFRPGAAGRPVGGDLRRWDPEGRLIGGTVGAAGQTDLVFDRDESGRVLSVTIRLGAGHLVIQRPASPKEMVVFIPHDDDHERPVALPIDGPGDPDA